MADRLQSIGGWPTAASTRQRVTRACDRCNQLRLKCNGQVPCARCLETDSSCEYARTVKKRGKASQKRRGLDKAARTRSNVSASPTIDFNVLPPVPRSDAATAGNGLISASQLEPQAQHDGLESLAVASNASSLSSFDSPSAVHLPFWPKQPADRIPYNMELTEGVSAQVSGPGDNASHASAEQDDFTAMNDRIMRNESGDEQAMRYPFYLDNLQSYDQLAFDVAGAELLCGGTSNYQALPISALVPPATDTAPTTYDGSLAEQSMHTDAIPVASEGDASLKFPALRPLLPHLRSSIDTALACNLLESYFDSLFDASPHPLSPYVFGFLMRKDALLHPTHPRACSPAMLASMLWIAARTDNSPALTSSPAKRGQVCQQLLELTIRLLIPLLHGPALHETSISAGNVSPRPSVSCHEDVSYQTSNAKGKGSVSVDDIVAYMHIATVTSASEDKRASLRWWNAAWTLARELKLGRESRTRPTGTCMQREPSIADGETYNPRMSPWFLCEEQKEERRRVWWILYMIDRHLSLCYNKPIFLQNRECIDLLQPMDEQTWQAGAFWMANPNLQYPDQRELHARRGPAVEFTGTNIFGYMLPLMIILGEIIDLNYARNNPILGTYLEAHGEISMRRTAIERHLELYHKSMESWSATQLDSADVEAPAQSLRNAHLPFSYTASAVDSVDSLTQKQTAIAYSNYLYHVLHILSTGRWDPIELLDDHDGWAASESFRDAVKHAVSAADAASAVLDLDPDLSFMPFLFGIYLLQGSFLLLLVAEQFQTAAAPQVIRACETVVRAHEVCIVTLSTQYQKNFRNVMRSALAQARGRLPRDSETQQRKRREMLALYRWTADGGGLAL